MFSAAVDHPRREAATPGSAVPVSRQAAPDATGVPVHWEQPQPTVQPTLQRGEAEDTEVGGAGAPPAPEGVAAALGSTSPAPAKPGGADMDELARRLYAPMSALLRAELWLDRERSGRSMVR